MRRDTTAALAFRVELFLLPGLSYRAAIADVAPFGAEPATRGQVMLNLVVTLLIIALIAAVLGFGGIASAAVGIAKIVFLVALVLFLVAAIAGTMRTV
jgi:uncharacterized membrane protein YtjA (UPF0391 family)